MRFMKGRISMNQITLEVELIAESTDDDILLFKFEDGDCRVNLNTDSCQVELKEVFSRLIKLSIENEITLSLRIQDGYSRGLYKDVCTEYISELQRELNNVRENIRREMTAS